MDMKRGYRDFLLEIRVEELPSDYVRPALNSLKKDLLARFASLRIACGEAYVAGTATTLICCIEQVGLRQEGSSKEVIGPPKKVAFGSDRKSTRLNSSHTDISRMPSSA